MASKYDFGWTRAQLLAELIRLRALLKEKKDLENTRRALRDVNRALERIS